MCAGAVQTVEALPAPAAVKVPVGSPQQHPPAASAPTAGSSGVFQDASSEIADIDQRLHALQNFLKMAKSSVGAV